MPLVVASLCGSHSGWQTTAESSRSQKPLIVVSLCGSHSSGWQTTTEPSPTPTNKLSLPGSHFWLRHSTRLNSRVNTNGKAPKPKPEAIPERGTCEDVACSCQVPEHLIIQPVSNTVGMNENDTHVGYRMFVQGMTTNGIAPKGKPEATLEPGVPEPNNGGGCSIL